MPSRKGKKPKPVLTGVEGRAVLDRITELLLENIRPDYAEDSDEVRRLIQHTCNRLTPAQGRVFLMIYEVALEIIANYAIRTRRVRLTSSEPIGISYYDSPIRKYKSHEVMFRGFPTRKELEHLEFYFSGVGDDPHRKALPLPGGQTRFGVPVLRAIEKASNETVQWATSLLRTGYSRSR